MEMPTVKQVQAGNFMSQLLVDACCAKAFGDTLPTHPKYQTLIDLYLTGEIESVTAIYLAMQQEES